MKTKQELIEIINSIQRFQNEQRKLQDVIDVIAAGSTAVADFGSELLDDYIGLADLYFDSQGWIDWFVYENNFGKRKMQAGYDGNVKEIKDIDDLWELIKTNK